MENPQTQFGHHLSLPRQSLQIRSKNICLKMAIFCLRRFWTTVPLLLLILPEWKPGKLPYKENGSMKQSSQSILPCTSITLHGMYLSMKYKLQKFPVGYNWLGCRWNIPLSTAAYTIHIFIHKNRCLLQDASSYNPAKTSANTRLY